MMRIVLLLAAAAFASPARAQSLDGGIWSGFPTGLASGFSGGIYSGLHSGLGARDGGRRAQIDDVTLGSAGTLQRGFLRGQPSNFGPSVQSTGPLPRSRLTFENGPELPLEFRDGPAGPLD